MRNRRPKSATEKKKSKSCGDFKGPVKITPGTAKEELSLCPVPLWCCLDRAVTARFWHAMTCYAKSNCRVIHEI